MATTAPEPSDGPFYVSDLVWVSLEVGRRMFDEAARERAGISGEEFIRRYEAGGYADMVESEDNRHIVDLALTIPLARQNGLGSRR